MTRVVLLMLIALGVSAADLPSTTFHKDVEAA